jgi:hypothetical protein
MIILDVATQDGDVVIREDELASVTDAELAILRLSRKQMHDLFAEGVKLMQGTSDSNRVRPVAISDLHGNWEVMLIQFSPLNDPLMQGRRKGKPN